MIIYLKGVKDILKNEFKDKWSLLLGSNRM